MGLITELIMTRIAVSIAVTRITSSKTKTSIVVSDVAAVAVAVVNVVNVVAVVIVVAVAVVAVLANVVIVVVVLCIVVIKPAAVMIASIGVLLTGVTTVAKVATAIHLLADSMRHNFLGFWAARP